jgi:hypothetical protein
MYEMSLTGTLDFNINYNGAGTDTGISYSVAPGCESILSVNASTGVVTPLAVGVGVVLVKTASNVVVQKLAVSVVPAAEYTIREQLASGAITLAAGIAAANGQ